MEKDYKKYFNDILDNMLEGAAIHQMLYNEQNEAYNYRILKINKGYENILGLKKDNVEGELASEVYGDLPAIDIYKDVVENKKPIKFNFYYSKMNKHFSISAAPFNSMGFITIFFDITETLEYEEVLKNNEMLYHSLFEKSNVSSLLINPKTLDIIDVNNKACCFYGYNKKIFRKMKFTDINLLPKKMYIESIQKVKNGEQNIFDFKHKTKKEEIKEVECNLNLIKIKKEELLIIRVKDLTELKKSEIALKYSEKKLLRAELISKTGNWEMKVDDNILTNNIITASEGAKHIYDLENLDVNYMVYEKINNMALKEYREMMKNSMLDLINYNTPYNLEFKIKTVKNNIKDIRSIGKYDPSTNTIYGVIRDITEEKRNEEELEKSNTIKSTFLSNISHELRTPMNAVIGFSNILLSNIKNGKENKKDYKRFIRSINSNAKHLEELLTNILDYSKLDNENFDILYENFNINDLFQELYDIFYEVNYRKNLDMVKLQFDMSKNRKIVTDYLRIKQVLFNIISNSIKFTESGDIKISYEIIKDKIVFKIEDTGIGIAEKDKQFVFDDFWQSDSSSRKKYGGTGLGLSISKSIIELLSGDIWFSSEINVGTTFFVEISLEEVIKKDSENKKIKNSIFNKCFSGKTVLIVDEIPTNYSLLGIYLNSLHINIINSYSGKDAIEKFNKQKDEIDLIFIDLYLPDMEITEISKKLKEIKNDSVIISKSGTKLNNIDSIDYYLHKPINKEDLILILDEIWQE